MVKKPWSGRFSSEESPLLVAFSESLSFDCRLAEVDIQGSLAWAEALKAARILSAAELSSIKKGLAAVREEIREGRFKFRVEDEDIHMAIERSLTKKIGQAGAKLHTGRSRNDQVALDTRMYFRSQVDDSLEALTDLCSELTLKAEDNIQVILPGMTHTREAQPVLLSHHLLAYVEMFLRDRERLIQLRARINVMPLGSGALAGSGFAVDRNFLAERLGFDKLSQNSLDAVSDRDYLLEFGAAASIIMLHLSRMMEEWIWWSSEGIEYLQMHESFCTGSSMMPNKKNPDAAELIRGKSGRVVASLMGLITVMKGTPLTYNRDFQEDKEGMFDAADTLIDSLRLTAAMVPGIDFNAQKMQDNASAGFATATDLADYLVLKKVAFREAHSIAGKIVRYCLDKGIGLSELTLDELKKFSEVFKADALGWLTIEASVARRNLTGGTAPAQVKKQVRRLKRLLKID